MLSHSTGLQQLADLRSRAAHRLSGGKGVSGTGSAGNKDSADSADIADSPSFQATDALAVLHAMASSQDTAGDALALLHELQVHQIEVELQAEELRDSRIELETALRRQTALYEAQPVACFTVDRELVVAELNPAGARLLGLAREEACGLPLGTLLSPASAAALQQLLLTVGPGTGQAAKVLQWVPLNVSVNGPLKGPLKGPLRSLRADVGHDPSGTGYLVVLTELIGLVD